MFLQTLTVNPAEQTFKEEDESGSAHTAVDAITVDMNDDVIINDDRLMDPYRSHTS